MCGRSVVFSNLHLRKREDNAHLCPLALFLFFSGCLLENFLSLSLHLRKSVQTFCSGEREKWFGCSIIIKKKK